MTVAKINYNQTYLQDEHQRQQQQLVDAVNLLQNQIVTMQAQIAKINLQLGIK